MRLLLIGHGYLGHAVAEVFRHEGWEVIPVSLSGGDGSISCDIGDREAVKGLPSCSLMIHCAASGRGGPDAYRHVYVEGSRNLISAFPGTRFVFTSSTSVYAQTDGSVVTETSPAEPDRETGKLLLEAERITLECAGGSVARLAGIYGPGRSVILKKFLAGESVMEEEGRRFLNQIHRDDAARALFHIATGLAGYPGKIFNVSDSTPLTQLDCHEALSKMFSRPMPPSGPRDPNRKRGWTHKQVSSAKLRETGWQPVFPSFLDAAPGIASTL